MFLQLSASARTRYILREGILRRGLILGALIAAAGIIPEAGDFSEHWHAARVGAVLVLAWSIWTVITGWIVGAYLWSKMQDSQSNALDIRYRRPRRPE